MKKRSFSTLIIALLVLITALPFSVSAEESSGVCGQALSWKLDTEGSLVISGSGSMTDWQNESDVPWHSQREDIIHVTVESGVLSVGENAFSGCTNLMSATLDEGIETIGKNAFRNCGDLFAVVIPDSVKTIKELAFYNCSSLSHISFGNGLETIEASAFSGCASLGQIYLPASLKSVGEHVFRDCAGLLTASFEEGLVSVGEYAFFGLKKFERVKLPSSLSFIGDHAFEECPVLSVCTYSGSYSAEYAEKNKLDLLLLCDMPYTDVSFADWYYQGAAFLYNNKLDSENNSTIFDPQKELTYADAVKLACAVYQLDQGIDLEYDISYMTYAFEKGITKTNLSEKADQTISRKDFADIIFNAMPREKYTEINKLENGAIPDVKDNEKIYTFYRAGILTGCDSSGSFNPDAGIKKSEAAIIAARMLEPDARRIFTIG